jgi:hypothetical protein
MNIEEYQALGRSHVSKYRNKRCTVDGIQFASIHEAGGYNELNLRQKAGEVRNIRCQVPFVLLERFVNRNYAGIIQGIKYIADFVFDEKDQYGIWREVCVDYKASRSFQDPVYKLKKKLLLSKYPDLIFREVFKS